MTGETELQTTSAGDKQDLHILCSQTSLKSICSRSSSRSQLSALPLNDSKRPWIFTLWCTTEEPRKERLQDPRKTTSRASASRKTPCRRSTQGLTWFDRMQ